MRTSAPASSEKSLARMYAWVIVLVTLLTVGAALAVALERQVTYTSEARIEVLPIPTRGAPIAPDMGTEREVAISGSVADDAAAWLGTSRAAALKGLDVSVVADTAVLVVRYTAASPEDAHDGATAFTRSYVTARNERQKVRIVSVITSPGTPHAGSRIDYVLIVGVGLLIGLSLGLGAAWLWDRVADRVRSASELERAGPPVVAALRLPSNLPAAGDEDRGFAFLAGRLSSMTGERRSGVRILVTSPRRQSGTSRVAVNTAAGLAGLGRHVVLIDADVSSWGSSSMIADSPRPGFAEVLCGSASAEEALRPTGLPDVHLLPAAPSGSPAPLNVDNLKLMLGQLAARNVVVVDGPALLTSPETLVLAGHVDIILLVADLRTLRRREAAAALRLLEGAADGATIAWVTHTPGVGRDGREPSGRRPSSDDESGLDDADAGRPIDVSRPPRS